MQILNYFLIFLAFGACAVMAAALALLALSWWAAPRESEYED